MALLLGPHSSNGSAQAAMPHPKGDWGDDGTEVGGLHTTAASVYKDVFDRRRVWTFDWEAITSAQLATLRAEEVRNGTLDMTPPETAASTSYFVVVVDGGIKTRAVHTGVPGTYRWNVSMTLRET